MNAISTSDRALRFIDEREVHMVSRPHAYASTPDALEQMLMTLEEVRAVLCDIQQSEYITFLFEEGYSATFCSRHRLDNVSIDFDMACSFIKTFLSRRGNYPFDRESKGKYEG